MTIEAAVDSGPTEGGDDDLQEPHEASLEDLDEYLKDAVEKESKGDSESATTQPAKAADQQNSSEPPAEGEKKTDPASKKAEDFDPEKAKEQLAKQQKQIEQQELFIKERSTEIGELRKQVRERNARLKELADAAEAEGNHREAAEIDRKREELKSKDSELRVEAERLETIDTFNKLIPKYCKPEEFNLPAMKEELVEAGLSQAVAQKFVENIHEACHPETAIWLGKLAFTKQVLKRVVDRALELQTENEQLKTKSKNRGEQVLNGIKGALSAAPTMTAASASANNPDRTPSGDPSTWSLAQIDAYLAKNK